MLISCIDLCSCYYISNSLNLLTNSCDECTVTSAPKFHRGWFISTVLALAVVTVFPKYGCFLRISFIPCWANDVVCEYYYRSLYIISKSNELHSDFWLPVTACFCNDLHFFGGSRQGTFSQIVTLWSALACCAPSALHALHLS